MAKRIGWCDDSSSTALDDVDDRKGGGCGGYKIRYTGSLLSHIYSVPKARNMEILNFRLHDTVFIVFSIPHPLAMESFIVKIDVSFISKRRKGRIIYEQG